MAITQTILVVEDDPNDVHFLKLAITRTGIRNAIQVAAHGREAMDYLNGVERFANRTEFPLPCLVLLDLNLPYLPGLEVLKRIRQQPALAQMIVVVLSSSQEESDVNEAYNLGVNAYVVKPPSTEKLRDLVNAIKDFWLVHTLPPPRYAYHPPDS